MKPSDLIPLRWPAGPGEEWKKPESLGILDGTPFNCLVLESASSGMVEAARKRGLTVFGSARGLDAGVTESTASQAGKATGDVIAVTGCDWPSVRVGRSGNAESGPTGYPWVNANGWISLLASAQAPGKTIWTTAQPKDDSGPVRPEMYALAVADSAAYGTRWLATLDSRTSAGLLKGEGPAKEAWTALVQAVRFFEERRPRSIGQTFARLGILSDFAGLNEALAKEFLNLTLRRQLPSRILDPGSVNKETLDGLKLVVVIDRKAPSGPVLKELEAFLASGGTVVLPVSAGHLAEGRSSAGKHNTGYSLFTSGSGMMAVAPKPWTNPYALATDAHRLLSHSNDVVRLWNAGSSISYPQQVGAGTFAHVLNYTGRPVGHPMSLWVAMPFRQARFFDLFGRSEALEVISRTDGTEVSLPPFTSYAAVEFREKS
ncbi:MAG: hypothetical protein H7Y20_17145 [Bryobacteraceae bacterium]|nr:hypothetical protein [Bryobacteraceae bacterium]